MTAISPDRNELLRRLVPIAGTHNFRDIGGYSTHDGGTTRWGRLFRSDALHRVEVDAEPLAALRLRTVVDLRSPSERSAKPNNVGNVVTVACPVFGEDTVDASRLEATSLAGVYERMIAECGGAIAAAVKAIARPGALPAVVHCAAGKDRTGVVVGLLLSSLGVPDDTVALDFAATELCLTDDFTAILMADHPNGVDRALLRAPASLMLDLLGRLQTEHGGARAYLEAHGVTPEEQALLRRELVAVGAEPEE